VRDPRVRWTDAIPADAPEAFDRVLCGAAIWQLSPLESTLGAFAALLVPGGAAVFNIPARYVLEVDLPGDGRDPWLLDLPRLVDRASVTSDPPSVPTPPIFRAADVDALLAAAGFRIERWSFQLRLTQSAYRDWLKIPPVSDGLLAGLSAEERERRLEEAYRRSDRRSWRWERWLGWTAWRER
jgi:hypothetical protein